MTDDYNPRKDAHDSYFEAVAALRKRFLEQQRAKAMKYEYVITDGVGTLIEQGEAHVSRDDWNDKVIWLDDVFYDAMQQGFSFQCAPVKEDEAAMKGNMA